VAKFTVQVLGVKREPVAEVEITGSRDTDPLQIAATARRFFEIAEYKVGDKVFSAQDIEEFWA
jgi:hypothetical protein